VLRRGDWPPEAWSGLHPLAWRRLLAVPGVVVTAATVALTWQFGAAGLLGVVALPLLVIRARRWAATAGYAEWSELVGVRTGWLNRRWEFTEVPKLQSLRVTSSPFDRRYGMATIWLDTAGAPTRDGVLRIPYLPADEARALFDRLSAGMTTRRQSSG